jgi:SulP family sulfate permease
LLMTEETTPAFRFRPKLIDCLKGYTRADFGSDLAAGTTVGIAALSLAMALGIASNSTPAAGIFTAIIAGFLISALGGSRVQIGGPTAAFIPIVVAVGAQYRAPSLAVLMSPLCSLNVQFTVCPGKNASRRQS